MIKSIRSQGSQGSDQKNHLERRQSAMTILEENVQKQNSASDNIDEYQSLTEQFQNALKISDDISPSAKQRQIKLTFLTGDLSLNLLKTTHFTIELIREEITEVEISSMGKSLVSLMR